MINFLVGLICGVLVLVLDPKTRVLSWGAFGRFFMYGIPMALLWGLLSTLSRP